MKEVKIEKGIPIPSRVKFGENRKLLESMEVGDSVFFNLKRDTIWARYYNPALRLGIEITVRKDGEGCRMWRTK